MDNKIKNICNNIKKGRQVKESLPQFLDYLAAMYKTYANVNIAMNYFIFYENYLDNYHNFNEKDLSYLRSITEIIRGNLLATDLVNTKDSIKELDEVRNGITKEMKILTTYSDIFQVYEHVLNRIEFNFHENLNEIDNDLATKQIMNYIFDTEDQVVIQHKIKEVISQLPVRMSRYKYFDLIHNSFTLYKEGTSSSLDSYLYMLRTSAMLYKPEGIKENYPEFCAFYQELESVSYDNLSEKEWKLLSNKLKKVAKNLTNLVDYYYELQEIVNQLYIYLLCKDSSPFDENQENPNDSTRINTAKKAMSTIIKKINLLFEKDNLQEELGDIEELLHYAEGIPEDLFSDINELNTCFYHVKEHFSKEVKSLNLDSFFHQLEVAQLLMSESLFVDLEEVEEEQQVSMDRLKKEEELLLEELKEVFVNNSKHVTRGIMASTLDKLPLFLTSYKEVEDYIKSSLEQCRNLAEKTASIKLIQSFWE